MSKAPAILTQDDHTRGCQGREYTCTCGYDDRIAATLSSQEELRKALETSDALLSRAQGILSLHLAPNGTAQKTVSRLLDLLDCPEQRAVQGQTRRALEGSKR